MFDLTTRDIKYLSGVGPQRASVLNKELGIFSFHDLLYYFPYKYVDRSRIYCIREIDGAMPYIQLKGEILGLATATDSSLFGRYGDSRPDLVSRHQISDRKVQGSSGIYRIRQAYGV